MLISLICLPVHLYSHQIHLDDVSEAGLLRNIRIRFGKDRIYVSPRTVRYRFPVSSNMRMSSRDKLELCLVNTSIFKALDSTYIFTIVMFKAFLYRRTY